MSIRIGLQLNTVRDYMKRNLQETMVKVAGCGYQGVEFAGFYRYSAGEVRSIMNALGIAAVGAHIEYDMLMEDTEKQFDFVKSIGMNRIIIPHLKNAEIQNDQVKKMLNRICDLAIDYQLEICYHNHSEEFEKLKDGYVLDVLVRSVPKIGIELDTYCADAAGVDLLVYMRRLGGRLKMLHIRDKNTAQQTENPNIGEGNMDIGGILQVGEEMNVPWAFVEMDETDGDQMICSSISRINLLKMGY